MNRFKLFAAPLAASVSLVGLAAPAEATVTAYDARTLALGGNSVGYAANGSLVYWNPAAVANSRNVGVFLPTIGLSLNNNVLGVTEALGIFSAAQNRSGDLAALGNTLGSGLFNRLGSADGLNIRTQTIVEPLGLSLGAVGPGSLALRVYGGATGSAQLSLSNDFAGDLNNLFFQKGFENIVGAANNVAKGTSAGATGDFSALQASVGKLGDALQKNMQSFIIDGKKKTSATTKKLEGTVTAAVTGTVAATYAQRVPLPGALMERFPDAQLSLGATGKVLQNGLGLLPAEYRSLQLAGGTGAAAGARFNPTAGSVAVSLNVDREVTALSNAIAAFNTEQNLATVGDLLAAVQGFTGAGLARSTVRFTSDVPDNTGLAADLGAHMRLDKNFAVGLTLVNPVLLWNARRTAYKYQIDMNSATPVSLVADGAPQNVAFRAGEPFAVRAGVAFTPQLEGKGPGFLVNDILLTAGLDAPLITDSGIPNRPVVSLGFEKLFGPLAIRVGTQQFGYAPFYTAGLGIQTRWVQLNAGAGADPSLRGAAASLSLGIGF